MLEAAAPLLIWGVVLHLIADWPLQNDWIANNKANLASSAGWIHAGIHGLVQLLVFPWWAALFIGVTHLLIDTRVPVVWWSQTIRQTQPEPLKTFRAKGLFAEHCHSNPDAFDLIIKDSPAFDVGTEVRFWTDQVFHIAIIAAASLLVVA